MKAVALVAVFVSGLSLAVWAQGSSGVVQSAADAIGATTLRSIQYRALDRRSRSSRIAWRTVATLRVGEMQASIDYTVSAMREETVRRDVEFPPRGGGADPFNAATGQRRHAPDSRET